MMVDTNFEISSELVGTKLPVHDVKVEWRHTANYAAATGDMNPFYVDNKRTEGVYAPPMFVVAQTWPLIKSLKSYFDFLNPDKMIRNFFHQSEHIIYNRLLRPGDRLSIKGDFLAMLPHQLGTKVYLRFIYEDLQGKPVLTQYMGALLMGVKLLDSGRGEEELPEVERIDITGKPIWTQEISVSREAPYIYDGCTNIVFPLYTSRKHALSIGLPDVVLHPTAALSFAVRDLINKEAGGDPTAVKALHARFSGIVLPGTSMHIELLHKSSTRNEKTLFFQVKNHKGDVSIDGGRIIFKELKV